MRLTARSSFPFRVVSRVVSRVAAVALLGVASLAVSLGTATPAHAATATTFHALTPARLQDTRSGPPYTTVDALGAGGGPVGPAQTIELAVRGRGGVPAHGAGSVALNITATDATSATFVTVFPGGGARPNASTINVVPGRTVANSTIVRLGPDGTVSLYNHLGDVHLVIDVLAWVPVGPAFTGVDPARLLDTRTGAGTATVDGLFVGGGARSAGSTLDLAILGRGGVPAAGVGSVALNVTVTEPDAATFVTVHPAGTSRPTASNLNAAAGATAAAMAIVPVGSTGAVSLFQFAGNAHVVVDVLGWFPTSASFTGVVPARLADTRSGAGISTVDGSVVGGGAVAAAGTLDVPVLGRGSVPSSGVGAVVLNVTITEPEVATYVTVHPAATSRPIASNLNAVPGDTVANTVIVPVGAGGSVSLFQFAGSAHLVVDVLGWFPPSIDLPPGVTSLVSATASGRSSTTGWAEGGEVSADGRFVAFDAEANDLVSGDSNGVIDAFVRDRVTGVTERVNVSSAGAQAIGGASFGPALSSDGRFVTFTSSATNLVAGDSNGMDDVFVRDRQTGVTERVSVATGGAQGSNGVANQARISDDGRYVVFSSSMTNLVPGDTNGQYDVFRRDRQTGTTVRVSVGQAGTQMLGAGAFQPSISADGRRVTFTSAASNLVDGDSNAVSDVFLRDLTAVTTTRMSVSPVGASGVGASWFGAISADGRTVAFLSAAANLVAGDTNGVEDVFVRDLVAGATTRVSVSSDGAQSQSTFVWQPTVSADGRFVAFSSDGADLVDDDTNGATDAFVRDRVRSVTYRVSVTTDGAQVAGASGVGDMSGDGRVVTFLSEVPVTNVDGNVVDDVWVRVFAVL